MKKVTTEAGQDKIEVVMIQELNSVLADCDEVLAFSRNTEDDAVVIVTQRQITAIQGASVLLGG